MTFIALRATVLLPALLLLAPGGDPPATARPAARAASLAVIVARQEIDGKAIYLEHCKVCHGVLGAPTKASIKKYEKIPDFTDATFFTKRSDDSLVVVLKKGAGRDMKSLADKLSVEEMKAVSKYIHTLAKKS